MNRQLAIIAAGIGVIALVLGWVLMSSLSRVLRTTEEPVVEQAAQPSPAARPPSDSRRRAPWR